MRLVGVSALLLALSPLAVGCGSDPTCDDVGSLERRQQAMEPDDPDFNSVTEDLIRAQTDCNS